MARRKSVERVGDPARLARARRARELPEAAEVLAKRIREEQHEPQAFVVRLDP